MAEPVEAGRSQQLGDSIHLVPFSHEVRDDVDGPSLYYCRGSLTRQRLPGGPSCDENMSGLSELHFRFFVFSHAWKDWNNRTNITKNGGTYLGCRAGRDELVRQVLDDTLVDDLMSCLTSVSEESLGRSALQARAITSILAAVRSFLPVTMHHTPAPL